MSDDFRGIVAQTLRAAGCPAKSISDGIQWARRTAKKVDETELVEFIVWDGKRCNDYNPARLYNSFNDDLSMYMQQRLQEFRRTRVSGIGEIMRKLSQ